MYSEKSNDACVKRFLTAFWIVIAVVVITQIITVKVLFDLDHRAIHPETPSTIQEQVEVPKVSNISTKDTLWDNLFKAICWNESRMQTDAVNKSSGAAGIAQQKKVYVDDVNRILGENRYSYEDRFDPIKAREMFEISQGYYNPEKDFAKAVGIHAIGPTGYKRNPDKAKVFIDLVDKTLKDRTYA